MAAPNVNGQKTSSFFSGHPVIVARTTIEIKGVQCTYYIKYQFEYKCRGGLSHPNYFFYQNCPFQFDWCMYKKSKKKVYFFVTYRG